MIDEYTLLNAIRSNPDDDTVRLVYADWLEERGEDIRASFIRGHVELENNRCSRCQEHAMKLGGRRIDYNRMLGMFPSFREELDVSSEVNILLQVRSEFPDCEKCNAWEKINANLPKFSTLHETAAILGVPEYTLVTMHENSSGGRIFDRSYTCLEGYKSQYSTSNFCRGLLVQLYFEIDDLLSNLARLMFVKHPITSIFTLNIFQHQYEEVTLWDSGTDGFSRSHEGLLLPREVFRVLKGGKTIYGYRVGRQFESASEGLAAFRQAFFDWHLTHLLTPIELKEMFDQNDAIMAEFAVRQQEYITKLEHQRKIDEEAHLRRKQQEEKNDARVRLGIRCPQCDFCFGWDGSSCEHCKYVTPYSG